MHFPQKISSLQTSTGSPVIKFATWIPCPRQARSAGSGWCGVVRGRPLSDGEKVLPETTSEEGKTQPKPRTETLPRQSWPEPVHRGGLGTR